MVAAASALGRAEKTVAISHNSQSHRPSPVSVGFVAPRIAAGIRFRPKALAAAIARTITLRDAPEALLAQWSRSALLEVEVLIANGPAFGLSPTIRSLADAERSAFAGRVGAGMADLVMNVLGYRWRDNAACLLGSGPRPDFIYGGGQADGHGVVLVEAHGSFAEGVNKARMEREAKRKYLRQVKPHVGGSCLHGQLVHGYSTAFGSQPTSKGTFLHVTEKRIPKPTGMPKAHATALTSTERVTPSSLTLATYRANFLLMGAAKVVAWLDWLRGVREAPPASSISTFFSIEQQGRRFLAAAEAFFPHLAPDSWIEEFGFPPFRFDYWRGIGPWLADRVVWKDLFVMDEDAAISFLNQLSSLGRNGRDSLPPFRDLPSLEPLGFTLGDEGHADDEDPRYPLARFRDGLALLGRVPPSSLGRSPQWRWSPEGGFNAQ